MAQWISVPEAVGISRASDSSIRRLIKARGLKSTRKKRGKRTYVYVDRDQVLAAFGPAGASAGATDGATEAARGGTAGEAGTLGILRERVGLLEKRNAELATDLERVRAELADARAEARGARERLESVLATFATERREPLLLKAARGVREAGAVLMGRRD